MWVFIEDLGYRGSPKTRTKMPFNRWRYNHTRKNYITIKINKLLNYKESDSYDWIKKKKGNCVLPIYMTNMALDMRHSEGLVPAAMFWGGDLGRWLDPGGCDIISGWIYHCIDNIKALPGGGGNNPEVKSEQAGHRFPLQVVSFQPLPLCLRPSCRRFGAFQCYILCLDALSHHRSRNDGSKVTTN